MKPLRFFVFSLLLLFSQLSFATRFYTVIQRDCTVSTGLVVNAVENSIDFLSLDGRHQKIIHSEVSQIIVFDVVDSPFHGVPSQTSLIPFLKRVSLSREEEPTTIGWPIRFIENLVVFFDVSGKTHVYELESIIKLQAAEKDDLKANRKFQTKSSLELDFSSVNTSCKLNRVPHKNSANRVVPTQILADQLKIDAFFDDLYVGYQTLEAFQERTNVYSSPQVFKDDSRLGIILGDLGDVEPAAAGLAYFKTSGGRPYNFQSEFIFGTYPMKHAPVMGPIGGVSSSAKSHFFHAHFTGNLQNVAAGKPVLFPGDRFDYKKNIQFMTSYNYLGLIGGDYGPFSLSFGYLYPSFGIQLGDRAREILGSESSAALRFEFTTDDLNFHIIGSQFNFGKMNPTEDEIVSKSLIGEYYSSNDVLTEFSFNSFFIRGGVGYKINQRLSSSLSAMVHDGEYSEVFSGSSNYFKFQKIGTELTVKQEFGRYTAIEARWIQIFDDWSGRFQAQEDSKNSRNDYIYGIFEFIF